MLFPVFNPRPHALDFLGDKPLRQRQHLPHGPTDKFCTLRRSIPPCLCFHQQHRRSLMQKMPSSTQAGHAGAGHDHIPGKVALHPTGLPSRAFSTANATALAKSRGSTPGISTLCSQKKSSISRPSCCTSAGRCFRYASKSRMALAG